MTRRRGRPHDVVLLSGGIDSAAALALAIEGDRTVSTLFVDYGQPARIRERRASAEVAEHFHTAHQVLTFAPCRFGPGEIRGRNMFLISSAFMARSPRAGNVIIGIHSGSPYPDCKPDFLRAQQLLLDLQTSGTVGVAAPFIDFSKNEVIEVARRLRVPFRSTYSCEAANEPCGRCLSCVDRESGLAGA